MAIFKCFIVIFYFSQFFPKSINIVYNHNKWPINLNDAFTYAWVEKGSNYLIKEFPDKKEYEETKEKVQDI